MRKELLSFKNLTKFMLIILVLLSISFIVQYNIKEYERKNNNDTKVVKEKYSFLEGINASELTNRESLNVIDDIKNVLNKELYTIDSPLVIYNPYAINPLSAYISFTTKEAKEINVVINGKYSYTSNKDTIHILPVYYLIPNERNYVTLNGIEVPLEVNYEYSELNNTSNMTYLYNSSLYAYEANKLSLVLNITLDDYLLLSNGNILIKDSNKLIEYTPYGYIVNEIFINSKIIDYIENNNTLYILTNNDVIKLNLETKEKEVYNLNTLLGVEINPSCIDIYGDKLYIVVNTINSIVVLNTNGEILYIFGDKFNENDYYLKKNYYTRYLTNILDLKYKNDYLYVLDGTTLRVFIINETNRTIRQYRSITTNASSITYEDELILNNSTYDNFRLTNTFNIDSSKTYIKYPFIRINENNKIYFDTNSLKANSIDESTINDFINSESLDLNIEYINNNLVINNTYSENDEVSIILIDKKGLSYEYDLINPSSKKYNYIDLSQLNEGKYFIYTKVNSKVYNINRYVSKRSI